LLLIIGGAEVGRTIRVTQAMNTLSREVGNATYRDCAPIAADTTLVGVEGRVSSCVEKVVGEFADQMQTTLPNAKVVVSVYSGLATEQEEDYQLASSHNFPIGVNSSGLKNVDSLVKSNLTSFFSRGSAVPPLTLVVSEVFYQHKSIW
jgi:hypothetical protein